MAGQLALWDLRAEQVMDRVFAAVEAPPPALPAAADPAPAPGQGRRRLLLAGAGLGLLVGSLVHLWQAQQRVQLDLQQERQWRMLERLRALDPPAPPPLPAPPAPAIQTPTPTPTPAPAPRAQPQRKVAAKTRRPRPRHAEPTRPIGPPPIRVPLPAPTPPLPELLGVVQTTGQRDSAIFSTAAGPLSVSAGESIGGTGWRLLGVTADSVEIGQGSERRSLSLGR
jgi:hypothetical protein